MKYPTETEIQYMRIAMGLTGLPINDMVADTILRVVAELNDKKGKFSVHDAVRIEADVHRKYKPKVTVTTKNK